MSLPNTIIEALNSQFNHERANEAMYRAISDRLKNDAWDGSAHWFEKQADEEATHARKIAEYLIDNNVSVCWQTLPDMMQYCMGEEQPLDFYFQAAFAREKMTTAMLDQIYHLADLEESPRTHQFMLWFVAEQVEEERALVDIINQLSRAVGNDAALLVLDEQYGER
jgi:ferritin